jgi:hypothetical protein
MSSGAAVSPAPEAGGVVANGRGEPAPPPADPLAQLRAAALALPAPLDALAAAATLAAMHHKCEHAQDAARMLRAYAVAHNLKIAQRTGAADAAE